MCRTAHSLLSTAVCFIQMLVRVFMTIILMIENVIRMILQTFYNFLSFMLQMISLVPICLVFLITTRLKCFMCGGGGPCPVNRGGTCDCLMSFMAIFIIFLIFRATGTLDKIFYSLGYVKEGPKAPKRFIPTPGSITECSRNDSYYVNIITDNEFVYSTSYTIGDKNYTETITETIDVEEDLQTTVLPLIEPCTEKPTIAITTETTYTTASETTQAASENILVNDTTEDLTTFVDINNATSLTVEVSQNTTANEESPPLIDL